MSDPVGRVLAALADNTRRGIVAMLADGQTPTATEIAKDLPVTRQAVSKHLRALEEAHLVTVSRSGREARYRLEPEALRQASVWMDDLGARWESRLAALKDQVEATDRNPSTKSHTAPEGRTVP